MAEAIQRRSQQELGIVTQFEFLYKFKYQVSFKDIGAEHELCWVFVGHSNEPIQVNENEIAGWRYISATDLDNELRQMPHQFTPWFKLEWQRLTQDYRDALTALRVQLPGI